jgi:glutamate transport system permease protein
MGVLVDRFDVFASGFWLTLQICLLAGTGALILGTLAVTLRISPIPPLRAVGTSYVTVFRNLPLAVVLVLTVFGLPEVGSSAGFLKIPGLTAIFPRLGADLPYFRFGVLALCLHAGAFVCEALRSGVNAVGLGQVEAARALGLTFTQALWQVILPQAWRAAIVPVGSAIISMIKNSALVGFFGVVGDLSQTADALVSAEGLPLIPIFVGISVGYLTLTTPLGQLLDRIERRRAAVAG